MKKYKSMANESSARNIVGQGTIIKGDIELNGDFRIDGQITGSIKSGGKIVVGTTGEVLGDIHCQTADISGHIKGVLKANELVSLKADSLFEGELYTARISIEVGAKFNGKCQMTEDTNQGHERKKT
ncbi:MAG: polymer-forming cytoskeletal protein [Bacteroidales bacterium]|nr:polymer-forming cytoskeletal protein [Bacteroidales bacterium]MDD3700789.1 polymer-forming cytoskeletal protein [Bacteroidales bacterium]MDY0370398.1 polymer-forming cytoskeletal protein [Bacteroidales bacterium]